MLRHAHPVDDSDITWGKIDEYYTANLVNGLGNLVARVMKMAETHLVNSEMEEVLLKNMTTINDFNFQQALNDIWFLIQSADQIITDAEPFKLIKTNPEEAKEILFDLRQTVFHIATQLCPFMPETSHLIIEAVKANKKPDNLFPRLETK